MRECELLSRIYERSKGLSTQFPQVIVGPGDDCAVVEASSSRLSLTVDQLIEHKHYLGNGQTPVDLIARKAIARSISDLAAMCARPAWSLATAALPIDYPHASELFDALHHWATHWGAPLVGGDTATSPTGSPLVLTVTAAGEHSAGFPPTLRSGAQVGDEVWITGKVGNSLASGRHLTFEPRLLEAQWLARELHGHVHAMIDVSDGVGRDASRIAMASGVEIELNASLLPLHGDALNPIQAASDGEDYELLFTVSPNQMSQVYARSHGAHALPNGTLFTRIGCVKKGQGCFVLLDSKRMDASELGWDHS